MGSGARWKGYSQWEVKKLCAWSLSNLEQNWIWMGKGRIKKIAKRGFEIKKCFSVGFKKKRQNLKTLIMAIKEKHVRDFLDSNRCEFHRKAAQHKAHRGLGRGSPFSGAGQVVQLKEERWGRGSIRRFLWRLTFIWVVRGRSRAREGKKEGSPTLCRERNKNSKSLTQEGKWWSC